MSRLRILPRGFIALLTVLSSFAGASFAGISTAQAVPLTAIEISEFQISTISNLDPQSGPDQLVTLGGTFTNLTGQTIAILELNLVTSLPIKTRTELGGLLTDPTSGANLQTQNTSARLLNVSPNATRTWQVTFRGSEVFGQDASGVYAVGVAPDDASYGSSSVITTPWFFNADIKPTEVSFVVPLTTLNSNLATGEISNLKTATSEAGRLTELLATEKQSSLSWLLDSGLNSWATYLAETTDSPEAVELQQSLSLLGDDTSTMPYGHADLSALFRAGKQNEVSDVLALTSLTSPGGLVYYTPTNGLVDRQTVASLYEQNTKTFVSNELLQNNDRVTTSADATFFDTSVFVFDLAASSCLRNAGIDASSFFKTKICLTSEIAMMTAESPQRPRSVIILAPSQWAIASESLTALLESLSLQNWVTLTDLTSLSNNSEIENFVPQDPASQRNFSRTLLRQSEVMKQETQSVTSLYENPELASDFEIARINAYSDLWPSNAQASKYLGKHIVLLDAYLDAIQIEASHQITTPASQAEIPITIVNKSDTEVAVSVEITSNATSRFRAEPTEIISVASGQRVTVPVAITLVGAGIVQVQAQLVAPNGEAFGEVENIQISSTAYSQFARTLVLGAFGLLVLFALSNFVKRRNEKRRAS